MTCPVQEITARVVVLATGGTIAGTAASAADTLGYRSAQLGARQLVDAVPALAGVPLDVEQVAQIDSKDMDVDIWRRVAERVAHHLERAEVAGIVLLHGTDTLEETAYVLQRVLSPAKPVVLTGAMHPATALQADGPQNLADAVTLARTLDAPRGVCVVFAGRVFAPLDVRKHHARQLDAFNCGAAGDLGAIDAGRWRAFRTAPRNEGLGLALLHQAFPHVEIVISHAGAQGGAVDALVAMGVAGIVVAGTGNGTVHHALEAALLRAQTAGVVVRRSTRVAQGGVVDIPGSSLPASEAASAVHARLELMLDLMSRPAAARPASTR